MPEPLDQLTAALAERYRIEGELGAGGMAIVYRAHDIRHNRQVALKVIKPDLAAEKALEGDSQMLAWLGHDAIFDSLRGEPRFVALLKRLNFVK